MTDRLRFGFVTCVQLGLDVMDEIHRSGGELQVAITLEDELAVNKSGRVYVDEFCNARGIPVVKIASINEAAVINAVKQYNLDWLFVVGWSQIASVDVLEAPTQGCIGMHPTLLPEGRGRASIPWAILKRLPETGVTMFQLDEGVDTGPILAQARIRLTEDTTATELYEAVLDAHRSLVRDNWEALSNGSLNTVPQSLDAGSVWPGRRPEDGELSATMTVDDALRLVRATTHPYPGAFWRMPGGLVRVWQARRASGVSTGPTLECEDGTIEAVSFAFEVSAES